MSKDKRQDPQAVPGLNDPGSTRWSRLLNKVDKDPESALDDPRCLMPHFLDRYFDLCDGKVLEAPYVAHDYAQVALELAKRTGDRHQINRARGVAVHTFIGNTRWQLAADALAAYQAQALECCQVCASDWLRRLGDLLVENSNPRTAQAYLELSAQALAGSRQPRPLGRRSDPCPARPPETCPQASGESAQGARQAGSAPLGAGHRRRRSATLQPSPTPRALRPFDPADHHRLRG